MCKMLINEKIITTLIDYSKWFPKQFWWIPNKVNFYHPKPHNSRDNQGVFGPTLESDLLVCLYAALSSALPLLTSCSRLRTSFLILATHELLNSIAVFQLEQAHFILVFEYFHLIFYLFYTFIKLIWIYYLQLRLNICLYAILLVELKIIWLDMLLI